MDRDLMMAAAREAGSAALVTIIDVRGSAPRHPGSKMLVFATGEIVGTTGGGRGEALAIEAALVAVAGHASSILEVEMLGSEPEAGALICGGVSRMLVEYLSDPAPYAAAQGALEAGKRVVLEKRITRLAGTAVDVAVQVHPEGSGLPKAASRSAARARPVFDEAAGLFFDPLLPEEKLLILGGGHVGLALARAALPLGFAVSVADDRPDFLGAERFGASVTCLEGSYAASIAAFPFDEASYAVILTRGHLFDLESCRALLARPFRYAGLIGSARKIDLIKGQLLKDGFTREAIDALRAPVGIAIGAETPEEIAISILAQMIERRRMPSLK